MADVLRPIEAKKAKGGVRVQVAGGAATAAGVRLTEPAADLAVINRIAALGDLRGEMPELRKRYPRLDMTTWTRENRVQA